MPPLQSLGRFFLEKAMCKDERAKREVTRTFGATEKESAKHADAKHPEFSSISKRSVDSYMLQERSWISEIGYK